MPALVYEPLDYCRRKIPVMQEFNEINGQVIQVLRKLKRKKPVIKRLYERSLTLRESFCSSGTKT